MRKMLLVAPLVVGAILLVAGCGGGGGGGDADTSRDATARAYGRVSAAGVLTRSKNVSDVTTEGGSYGIALDADIDVSKTGVVATPDSSSPEPGEAIIESHSLGTVCPEGQLEVRVASRRTTDGPYRAGAASFFFVVP